jgi:integrase/recombinase XerD
MTAKKLKALVLLMRYSGLRISDAVMFQETKLSVNKVFLRQEKTGQPVWVPIPQFVVDAILECEEGKAYYFYSENGTPKSSITDWQKRLRKVYDMAGLPDGHSHRLRDTFAVALLSKGVSIYTVSKLLGHKSVKVTEKHYAPYVKATQDALEDAVKLAWV